MSTPDKDRIDAGAFEDYLSHESQISQRYRDLPAEDVPAHLDAAILAQARAAVAGKARTGADDLARVRDRRRRLMQWGVPTSIAASTLLVVSIVIRSGSQHEVLPAEKMVVQQSAPAPAAPPVAARQEEAADAVPANEGLVLIAPPRDAVTEFSSLAPRRDGENASARTQQRADLEREQARSVAEHAQRARQELREAAREMPPPAAVASIPTAPAAPMQEPQVARKMAADAAPAASPPQTASPAMAARTEAAEEQGYSLDEIAVTGWRASRPGPGAGPRGTVAASNGATSMADLQAEAARREADPELWLEYIRQLRRDSKPTSANRQWEQFRRAYPDYVVDDNDLARGKN